MRFTIGELSKKIKLSARAIRHYEKIGLIGHGQIVSTASRGTNNYRYYNEEDVKRFDDIKYLKSTGLSLREVKEYLLCKNLIADSNDVIFQRLQAKLHQLDNEMKEIELKKQNLKNLLFAIKKIGSTKSKPESKMKNILFSERRLVMEHLKDEVLLLLRKQKVNVGAKHFEYIEREYQKLVHDEKNRALMDSVKDVIAFAKKNNIKIGYGRGSAAASIFLHALGYTKFDPTIEALHPELYISDTTSIWFDVEYNRGKEFIDYCREISKRIYPKSIEAFKCPLLDIVENVQNRNGTKIDFSRIDSNSKMVLQPFVNADIERVYNFDAPAKAIIYSMETRPERIVWHGFEKTNDYLKQQKIYSFRDVLNIASILHRSHKQHEIILNEYLENKRLFDLGNKLDSSLFRKEVEQILASNFGMILYVEDIVDIIHFYTNKDYAYCKQLYFKLKRDELEHDDVQCLKKKLGNELVHYLSERSKIVYNRSHLCAEAFLIKQSAYLKSMYKKIYFEEIDKWEANHNLSWSEIGYKTKELSLMQN